MKTSIQIGKLGWTIIFFVLLLITLFGVLAGPADPTRFGNTTHTTASIGGENGTLLVTGLATMQNITFENGAILTENSTCLIFISPSGTGVMHVCD